MWRHNTWRHIVTLTTSVLAMNADEFDEYVASYGDAYWLERIL